MPFDSMPAETKPDVFSLEGLIAWLEMQNPAKRYDWPDPEDCLICHYLEASGTSRPARVWRLDSVFSTIGDYHFVGGSFPWTYGAALSRARKLLADQG